jgi:hypothetical protein
MGMTNKQIGWSTESNLLHDVSKKINRLINVLSSGVNSIIQLLTNIKTILSNFFDPSIIALNERGMAEGATFEVKLRFVQTDIDALYPINPKLLLYPSVYKTGKLYSVIPENGDGDFSVQLNGFDAIPNLTLVNQGVLALEFLPDYEITLNDAESVLSSNSGEIRMLIYFPYTTYLDVNGIGATVTSLCDVRFVYSSTTIELYVNDVLKQTQSGTYNFSGLNSVELGHLNGIDQFDGEVRKLITL